MFSQTVSGMEAVYWFCAILGTAFFVLRVVFGLVGGFGHDLPSHDLPTDMPHDIAGVDHGTMDTGSHGTEAGFKVLSMASVGAFIMMFGWVGLSAAKDFTLGGALSFLCALLAGFLTMLLTAYIFRLVLRLTNEGATFSVEDLVGKNAQVYHRIPAGGKGRIQVTLNGILREVDALAEDGAQIESFVNVTVTRALDRSAVYVKRAG